MLRALMLSVYAQEKGNKDKEYASPCINSSYYISIYIFNFHIHQKEKDIIR